MTLEEEKLNEVAARVEKFHNGARMFAAVKELKGTGPRQEVTVHDKLGEIISDTGKAAAAIAEHFQEQFTAVDETKISTFSRDPRPF